jgi:hypothetical protein
MIFWAEPGNSPISFILSYGFWSICFHQFRQIDPAVGLRANSGVPASPSERSPSTRKLLSCARTIACRAMRSTNRNHVRIIEPVLLQMRSKSSLQTSTN